ILPSDFNLKRLVLLINGYVFMTYGWNFFSYLFQEFTNSLLAFETVFIYAKCKELRDDFGVSPLPFKPSQYLFILGNFLKVGHQPLASKLPCRGSYFKVLGRKFKKHFLEFRLVLDVFLGLPFLDPEKRWLRDIEVTLFDQVRHLPVKERKKKGPDVGAIDIGISHQHYLVITGFCGVEFFRSDACAQCGYQCSYFFRGEHFIKTRFFHI